MSRHIRATLCLLALLSSPLLVDPGLFSQGAAAQQPGQPSAKEVAQDLGIAGKYLAEELGKQLVANGPGPGQGKYRVAVFPFGTMDNKYPLALGDNGPILRGRICEDLMAYLGKEAPGKFSVLTPDQLDNVLQSSTNDPVGVSGDNPELTRKILQKYNIQIGVVGNFQIPTLPCKTGQSVEVKARAVHPKTVLTANRNTSGTDLNKSGCCTQARPTGRFSVQIFIKVNNDAQDDDEKAWVEVPMKICQDKGQENTYYLVLKKEYKGKRYKVRITNNGKPKLGPGKGDDTDRLYEVCLMIDGVNSFFQEEEKAGVKSYRPVSGHALDLAKWVLTGPGQDLVESEAGIAGRVDGGKLIKADGLGHSQLEVNGFQKGDKFAAAFELAEAADSVAAPELLAGGTKIGTISAYFFAENLIPLRGADPEMAADDVPNAGTRAGEKIKSEVFTIDILNKTYKPCEVWHINYRFEGDPLPEKLLPVKP